MFVSWTLVCPVQALCEARSTPRSIGEGATHCHSSITWCGLECPTGWRRSANLLQPSVSHRCNADERARARCTRNRRQASLLAYGKAVDDPIGRVDGVQVL